jgi:uncharacterized protein YjbJ (UPF0337 family)
MTPATKHSVEGSLHEVTGAIKEKAGQILNNPSLEMEGKAEGVAGTVQKKVAEIEKIIEE